VLAAGIALGTSASVTAASARTSRKNLDGMFPLPAPRGVASGRAGVFHWKESCVNESARGRMRAEDATTVL
jgi:hypothetical protein